MFLLICFLNHQSAEHGSELIIIASLVLHNAPLSLHTTSPMLHTALLMLHTASLIPHTASLRFHTASLMLHTASLMLHTASLRFHTASLGPYSGDSAFGFGERMLSLIGSVMRWTCNSCIKSKNPPLFQAQTS